MNVQKIKTDELKAIFHYIGFVLIAIASFMVIPVIVSVIYTEPVSYLYSFTASLIISLTVGLLLYLTCQSRRISELSLKESMIFVLSVWLLSAFFSALPMILSHDLSCIDAYFESMSGITSTGFTMYSEVPVAYSIRIWRSLLQWFGGLGIIFMLIVLLPSSLSLKRLYFAEGKSEQMTPNIKETSWIFIKIYSILTILSIILYLVVGLDVFNALCYTFSALGTGGFSADASNLNNFSNPLIQLVTVVIMILGATNFLMYFYIARGKWRNVFKDIEVRYMFIFILLATIIVTFSLIQNNLYNGDLLITFRHALFQVVSVLTSTGFSSTDINAWPALSYHVLVVLMFIGGAVCSTASGMKVYNIAVMIKAVWWEIQSIFLPESVIVNRTVFHDDKKLKVTFELIKPIVMFLFAYLFLFIISTMIVLVFCNDFMVAYSVVAASIGNTGLGPSYITTSIPDIVKIVLIFDFLAGRLGIWPAVVPLAYFINHINDRIKK